MNLLESAIIRLRAPEPEDLELLYKWENDTSLWLAGNTRAPYSRFQLKQYILLMRLKRHAILVIDMHQGL